MDGTSIAADTSPEVHSMMIERWKSMTVFERAQVFRKIELLRPQGT